MTFLVNMPTDQRRFYRIPAFFTKGIQFMWLSLRPVVLTQVSIEPLGFDGAYQVFDDGHLKLLTHFLLSVILGKNGVRQNFGKLRKASAYL